MILNDLFLGQRRDRHFQTNLIESAGRGDSGRAPIFAGVTDRNPGRKLAFGSGMFEGHEILSEVDWYERSTLTDVLEQNKGRWIHFSNIPKLGVNPQSVWSENGPYGVYFYPVDFLLSRPERARDGNQFGTGNSYYFLCDLNLSSGISLSRITMDEVQALAEKNGWAQWFRPQDMVGGKPGAYMWRVLRNLHEARTISWNAALKGANFVLDDDRIMYGHLEPQQIVVMNPRIIKNVTMGRNEDVGHKAVSGDDRTFRAWLPAYKKVLDRLKQSYGGVLRWQEDKELAPYSQPKAKVRHRAPALPSLSFKDGDKAFTITAFERRMGDHGFRFTYRFRRETAEEMIISAHEMRKLTVDEIVAKITAMIDGYLGHDSDLRFEPFVSEEQAQAIITDTMGQGKFTFDTQVSNDEGFETFTMDGAHEATIDDLKVETHISLRVSKTGLRGGLGIKINGRNVGYATNYNDETEVPALARAWGDELEERLRSYERLFKFRDHEQWIAFVGFIAVNGGLSLDDSMAKRFVAEIAAYEAIEDKDTFHYTIERTLASRY